MRGLLKILVVLVILVGLVSYFVLPSAIENVVASRLQATFGLPTPPVVEVDSNFPPELLLGRIDGIHVTMDQLSLQGIPFYNAQADLTGVEVSMPSLIQGSPTFVTQSCSLSTETPAVFVDQTELCLSYLGL